MNTHLNPLISIIIPVYNVGHYLKYTLECVAKQAYTNLEILIIDDGSTDDSLSICQKYALQDPRFKVFHQQNQGVSQARNKGLELANGIYIGFVDSDDMPAPDMFSSLYANMVASNADLSICNTAFIGESTTEISAKPTENQSIQVNSDLIVNWQKILWGSNERKFYCIWDKLFKKDIIQKYDLRFEKKLRIGEDTLFSISYFLCCDRIVIDQKTLYNHRIRQGSLMRTPIPDLAKQQIFRMDKLEAFARKIINDQELADDFIQSFKAKIPILLTMSKQINIALFKENIGVICSRKDIMSAFYLKAESGSKREKLTAFMLRNFPVKLAGSLLYLIR